VTKREAILTETYVRKAHFGLISVLIIVIREPAIIGKTRYKTGKTPVKNIAKRQRADTIPPSATR
jgi:hypothetical protein